MFQELQLVTEWWTLMNRLLVRPEVIAGAVVLSLQVAVYADFAYNTQLVDQVAK